MTGTWSGAISRPNGSLVTFVWTATQDNANMRVAGPLALTLSGAAATGALEGNLGQAPGATTGALGLTFFTVNVIAGGVPGFPNCQITSAGSSPTASVTSTSFTSSIFTLKYFGCRGLIDQEFGSTIQESAQLTMTNTPSTGTPPPPSATERWVGVAPDGIIIEDGPGACTLELDLTLDVVRNGPFMTGTATTLERRIAAGRGCSGLGSVETWPVANGTIGAGTISFSFPPGPNTNGRNTIDFTGTLNATRMSGTLVTFGGRRGTFALNRQ